MSAQLQFELVSPEKLLFSKPVALVTVPGEEGNFGVLPEHAPLIASLRAGVVDIYEKDESEAPERIFISGGFAEVNATGCTLLVEEAVALRDLHPHVLEAEIKILAEEMENTLHEHKKIANQAKIDLMNAKLQALS